MFLGCHSICRGAHVVSQLEINLWHNVAHRGTSLDCHESFSQLSRVHQTATGLEWNKTGGYRWCLRTCVLVRWFGRPETEEITHKSTHWISLFHADFWGSGSQPPQNKGNAMPCNANVPLISKEVSQLVTIFTMALGPLGPMPPVVLAMVPHRLKHAGECLGKWWHPTSLYVSINEG